MAIWEFKITKPSCSISPFSVRFLISFIRSFLSLELTAFFPGYRLRAGSTSPVRRRGADRRYNSDLDHSGGLARSRDFGGARSAGRFPGSSPSYARERGGGRPFGRGPAGPDLGPGPIRREGINRNNPNVRPREGDWVCIDPL